MPKSPTWTQRVVRKRRALLRAVAARLNELEEESPGIVERGTGAPHGTAQGWTQVGKPYHTLPALEKLCCVADNLGVSLDWLVGASEMRLRWDRTASGGDLATALVGYVRDAYLNTDDRSPDLGGLALVLHGSVVEGEPNNVKVDEPRRFLTDVCAWVYKAAADAEADAREKERRDVLAEIAKLQKVVDDPADVRVLLEAALDPIAATTRQRLRDLIHKYRAAKNRARLLRLDVTPNEARMRAIEKATAGRYGKATPQRPDPAAEAREATEMARRLLAQDGMPEIKIRDEDRDHFMIPDDEHSP
jgi:hypothetical protein